MTTTLVAQNPAELQISLGVDDRARPALAGELFGSLAGIEEMVLHWKGERERPRARRMLT